MHFTSITKKTILLAIVLLFHIKAAHAETELFSETSRIYLIQDNIHNVQLSESETGGYEVITTGLDPYIYTAPFRKKPDITKKSVLAFEYFTVTPTNAVQIYFLPPEEEARSITGPGLGHSEGWITYTLDLSIHSEAWAHDWDRLRFDFCEQPDRTVRVRNIVLREPTERESEIAATREAREMAEAMLEKNLQTYLDTTYPCSIDVVTVDSETITISGTLGEISGNLFLAESPLYQHLTEQDSFQNMELLPVASSFEISLQRFIPLEDGYYDRLFSRWLVVQKTEDGLEMLSHARYTDTIEPKYDLPKETPRSKKGLNAFRIGRGPVSDLDELDITSATTNILLHFMRKGPGDGRIPFEFNGKTYYADEQEISRIDSTLQETAERDIIVSVVILVPKANGFADREIGNILQHPDCDPAGIYSMANVTTAEGLEYYAAALDFLAQRYTRPDKKYGRIHHWIVHNEVDAGWVWTNAGEKTPLLYMDQYHKSMRIAHLVGRKYSAHMLTFISLTHHWNWTVDPKFYHSSDLLDILLKYSDVEGDFRWAVAQHPYPQSLYNPRTWEDEKVDFTLETPLITYKNIEVLAAWARQPYTFYRGEEMRVIHLSEQGLNSVDYSEESLLDQAAGMAFAWKKFKVLPEIEVFQYHSWVDNRGEGGLRLGLRKFRDYDDDPFGKKPIWYLYQALGTTDEDAACAFALEHIGIDSWDDVRYTGEIK